MERNVTSPSMRRNLAPLATKVAGLQHGATYCDVLSRMLTLLLLLLAVANFESANVSILLGNGNGTFQAKVDYATGQYPTSVTAGDWNGDGKLDLAVANGDSNVSILLNTSQ